MRENVYDMFPKNTPGEERVDLHVDQHIYLDLLRASAKAVGVDLDAALTDPPAVFSTPAELVAKEMPNRLKMEILKRWAYVEKELEIASDDGMPSNGNGDRLQEINAALSELEDQS